MFRYKLITSKSDGVFEQKLNETLAENPGSTPVIYAIPTMQATEPVVHVAYVLIPEKPPKGAR